MRWILALAVVLVLGAGCVSRRHLSEQTGRSFAAVFAVQVKAAREAKDSPSWLGSQECVHIYQGYERTFMGAGGATTTGGVMDMSMLGGGGGGLGAGASSFSFGGK